MSYWGYKGINDPPSGCAGFVSAVLGLIFAPVILGAIAFGVGYALGGAGAAQSFSLVGVVAGLGVGLYNAVTMPKRVRKAKRMRDAYNRLYDQL